MPANYGSHSWMTLPNYVSSFHKMFNLTHVNPRIKNIT